MRKRINRIIAVVVSVMLVLSLCACGSSDVSKETAAGEEIIAEVADEKNIDETTAEESEAISEAADSVPDEEWTNEKCIEYINSCKMVEYKDLSRYPDRYINTPVRVDLCVKQDLDNGTYRGYDRDLNVTAGADPMQASLYYNNEYVFFDSRLFDSARILPEDIVTIYGDYTGPVTFTRAINNVEVEVPGIKAYFIDFWDASVADYVDELAAQEYQNEYEYEYDSEPVLQYDSDLEEQQMLDEEMEWRAAKMEAEKYILYDSDVRNLTYDDIKYLSKDDIRLAKNEIYARHGYIFKSNDLNEYFNQRWWYTPQYTSDTFDESVFNNYEKHNIAFLDEVYNNM